MANPLTYLNEMFEAFAERAVTGNDQLILLHLFNEFNRAHWPKELSLTDRELQKQCMMYDTTGKPASIETIRRAKSRLKLKGFIDYKRGSGEKPTQYRLLRLHPDTPPDTPPDTSPGTPPDTPPVGLVAVKPKEEVGVKRRREDVKTTPCNVKKEGDKSESRRTSVDPRSVWEFNA